jgi:hypothetical protein
MDVKHIDVLLLLGDYLIDSENWLDDHTTVAWVMGATWWILACETEAKAKRGMSNRQEAHFRRIFDTLSNRVAANQRLSLDNAKWMQAQLWRFDKLLGGRGDT